VDALMRISFRTKSDATRGITPEQNIRDFRSMRAAISACRNWKLCPCLLALDSGRITGNPRSHLFAHRISTGKRACNPVLRIMLRLTPRIAPMLPNLRTWAPCWVICLIKSQAIWADLSRFFRVGHLMMAGFGRQLASRANSVNDIAVIVSGFDSHRPLHKP
jgi:hypothetical protein